MERTPIGPFALAGVGAIFIFGFIGSKVSEYIHPNAVQAASNTNKPQVQEIEDCPFAAASRMQPQIERFSKATGLGLPTSTALMWQESSFSKNANTWCCTGPWQINYKAPGRPSKEALQNVDVNTDWAITIFNACMRDYGGSVHDALNCYYGNTNGNEGYAETVLAKANKCR